MRIVSSITYYVRALAGPEPGVVQRPVPAHVHASNRPGKVVVALAVGLSVVYFVSAADLLGAAVRSDNDRGRGVLFANLAFTPVLYSVGGAVAFYERSKPAWPAPVAGAALVGAGSLWLVVGTIVAL